MKKMNVGDLQALAVAAKHFAEAAVISETAKKELSAVCEALEPFKDMDVLAFAELLGQAQEYRRTGLLPVATSAAKKTAAKKPQPSEAETSERIKQLVQQLNDLYAVVHEPTTGEGAIREICAVIEKLKAPEVKKVAEGFGIKLKSKATKPSTVDEIHRKLTERKGSADRIRSISER